MHKFLSEDGSASTSLDAKNEQHWQSFADEFTCRPDTVYLNHGSFGLALNAVRQRRDEILRDMEVQPMDFYLRQMEPMLFEARQSLAAFVGTTAENLAFVDNATYAMNVVADSVALKPGDEVLLTDQTYGAVRRIWERAVQKAGATIVEVQIPLQIESQKQVVEAFVESTSPNTKVAIISHIISVSGLILPAKEICAAMRRLRIQTCVDGPHAPLQLELNIDDLGCDFYTASCHKWLCAPLGTGFLYVAPQHHDKVVEPVLGWGRLQPKLPASWDQEQFWLGTRNVAGALAIPAAIEYFQKLGLDQVRSRLRYLAATAEHMLLEALGTNTIASRSDGWYGLMAHVALPVGDWSNLQNDLWEKSKIEIPVWEINDRWWIRVSCHLYNSTDQLEFLLAELTKHLP